MTMKFPTRIKMIGEGGHGIKLFGTVLAKLLADLGYETSLSLEYDSAVRGGNITADVVISDSRITNPVVEYPDILILTARQKTDHSSIPLVIADAQLSLQGQNIESHPFMKLALEELGSNRIANMLILGRLLRELDIKLAQVDLGKYIDRFIEVNTKALTKGYELD